MVEAKRYFTIEVANAVVLAIRPIIAEILELRQVILKREPEIWPVVSKAAGNGGSDQASKMTEDFARLNRLAGEVQATGAEIKDINTGLVDFLALRDGREVYLCWQFGEDEVLFWHELEGGFANRQLW
ncbi:MAG TPA: DUF2203 domain-containing protein [Anaerolineales bacterium]|nr:DUF2203 domain-containing protein [Anaerolineales bacterium]